MSTALNEENGRESVGEHDPQFEPVITLPEVHIPTMEEDETILHTVRGKLFRLDSVEKEWKERGTGEAKLLYHKENNTVRMLMRRDRTLKLCANHYVTPDMVLKPNCGSDRAWLWSTPADAADGTPKAEILAIKFLNPDAARRWKDKFEEAKRLVGQILSDDEEHDEGLSCSSESESEEDSEIMSKMKEISLGESQKTKMEDEERNRENSKTNDQEEENKTKTKDQGEDNNTKTKDQGEDNNTKTKDEEDNKTKTKDQGEDNKTKEGETSENE